MKQIIHTTQAILIGSTYSSEGTLLVAGETNELRQLSTSPGCFEAGPEKAQYPQVTLGTVAILKYTSHSGSRFYNFPKVFTYRWSFRSPNIIKK